MLNSQHYPEYKPCTHMEGEKSQVKQIPAQASFEKELLVLDLVNSKMYIYVIFLHTFLCINIHITCLQVHIHLHLWF